MCKFLWVVFLIATIPVVCVIAVLLTPDRWIADRIESAGGSHLDADLQIGELSLDLLDWFRTVCSPLLAAIPYLEQGSGDDSDYCSGLVTSLDNQQ